jgi:hypothetical protein
MKISFVFTLLTVGCVSAAARGLKGKKGKPAATRVLKGKSACFENAYDAAAIGNKVLANFWADVHTTGCEPAGVAKVARKVFSKDVTVTLDGGMPVSEGIDALIANFVGMDGDEGSLTDLCLHHFVSWYGFTVVIDNLDPDNTFVLCSNELTSPQTGTLFPIGMSPVMRVYMRLLFSNMKLIFTLCILTGREYRIAVDKKCGGVITAVNVVEPFPVFLGPPEV